MPVALDAPLAPRDSYENLSVPPALPSENAFNREMLEFGRKVWDEVIACMDEYGFRNAQVTCIAPTGTIGLLMDCDTTGVEPDFALVKFKKLVGGGYFRIINTAIPQAMKRLGYSDDQILDVQHYILGHGTLEGSAGVHPDALRIRYCRN